MWDIHSFIKNLCLSLSLIMPLIVCNCYHDYYKKRLNMSGYDMQNILFVVSLLIFFYNIIQNDKNFEKELFTKRGFIISSFFGLLLFSVYNLDRISQSEIIDTTSIYMDKQKMMFCLIVALAGLCIMLTTEKNKSKMETLRATMLVTGIVLSVAGFVFVMPYQIIHKMMYGPALILMTLGCVFLAIGLSKDTDTSNINIPITKEDKLNDILMEQEDFFDDVFE